MWWHAKPSPDVEAAVARVPIFSKLKRRDLRSLASKCLLRRFKAGDSILEEGSVGLGCFILLAGRVEVFKTHDGRSVTLSVLGVGAVLGEIALLDDRPRSASAVALEDVECLLLSRDGFRTLLKRRPWIALPIYRSLPGRVRDLLDQLLEAKHAVEEHAQTEIAAEPPRDAPAPDPETVESVRASPQEPSPDANGTDVLRAPYALMMTGAVGVGESVRLFEVFFRSLDEASGLAGGRPMGDVLRALPASVASAGMSSWEEGRRLPSKLLGTFRDHLRSDWRGEDPA